MPRKFRFRVSAYHHLFPHLRLGFPYQYLLYICKYKVYFLYEGTIPFTPSRKTLANVKGVPPICTNYEQITEYYEFARANFLVSAAWAPVLIKLGVLGPAANSNCLAFRLSGFKSTEFTLQHFNPQTLHIYCTCIKGAQV